MHADRFRKFAVNSRAPMPAPAPADGIARHNARMSAPQPATRLLRDRSPVAGYALAVAASLAAVALAALAQRWFGLSDLSLVFMLAVVVVAARTDTGPAMLAAVLSFLGYNFFFIEPRYTLYIEARHAAATVLLFLAAAIIAGRLAARLSRQLAALREAQRHAEARRVLSQRLALAGDEATVLEVARDRWQPAVAP